MVVRVRHPSAKYSFARMPMSRRTIRFKVHLGLVILLGQRGAREVPTDRAVAATERVRQSAARCARLREPARPRRRPLDLPM
jgi:hypothetical protein